MLVLGHFFASHHLVHCVLLLERYSSPAQSKVESAISVIVELLAFSLVAIESDLEWHRGRL